MFSELVGEARRPVRHPQFEAFAPETLERLSCLWTQPPQEWRRHVLVLKSRGLYTVNIRFVTGSAASGIYIVVSRQSIAESHDTPRAFRQVPFNIAIFVRRLRVEQDVLLSNDGSSGGKRILAKEIM